MTASSEDRHTHGTNVTCLGGGGRLRKHTQLCRDSEGAQQVLRALAAEVVGADRSSSANIQLELCKDKERFNLESWTARGWALQCRRIVLSLQRVSLSRWC